VVVAIMILQVSSSRNSCVVVRSDMIVLGLHAESIELKEVASHHGMNGLLNEY